MTQAKIRLSFSVGNLEGNEYPFVEVDPSNPRHATLISQPHLAPGLSSGDVVLLSEGAPELTKALGRDENGQVVEIGTMPCYEVDAIVSKSGRTSILIPPSEIIKDDPEKIQAFQKEVKAAAKALFVDAKEDYSLSYQMGFFVLTTDPEIASLNRVLGSLQFFENLKSVGDLEVMDLGDKEGNEKLNIKPYPYAKLH